jgi:hypothetical protein
MVSSAPIAWVLALGSKTTKFRKAGVSYIRPSRRVVAVVIGRTCGSPMVSVAPNYASISVAVCGWRGRERLNATLNFGDGDHGRYEITPSDPGNPTDDGRVRLLLFGRCSIRPYRVRTSFRNVGCSRQDKWASSARISCVARSKASSACYDTRPSADRSSTSARCFQNTSDTTTTSVPSRSDVLPLTPGRRPRSHREIDAFPRMPAISRPSGCSWGPTLLEASGAPRGSLYSTFPRARRRSVRPPWRAERQQCAGSSLR